MSILQELAQDIKLPKMLPIRQRFPMQRIPEDQIEAVIKAELSRKEIAARIQPGMRIAIGCGSRGIANYSRLIKALVGELKSHGANPFLVPAMGSHGGATSEGQKQILASYGITEEKIGCPLLASMDVKYIGETDEGRQVFFDRYAAEADGVIAINRIKAHTAFRGKYESGLIKMLVIGFGKQHGAEACHASGFGHMAHDLECFGRVILQNVNVVAGIGIVENAADETKRIAALTPEEILCEEPTLLTEAYASMPRLYFDRCDLLIVDRIGKDISGDGMDPNVAGTFATTAASGGISAERRVVLDLTDGTHGCALGLGMADMTTRRAFDKIDFAATYPNAITCKVIEPIKIPMVLDNDRQAIQLAIRTCTEADRANLRIIRIADTLHLQKIFVSEAMVGEVQRHPNMEILGNAALMIFTEDGTLQ